MTIDRETKLKIARPLRACFGICFSLLTTDWAILQENPIKSLDSFVDLPVFFADLRVGLAELRDISVDLLSFSLDLRVFSVDSPTGSVDSRVFSADSPTSSLDSRVFSADSMTGSSYSPDLSVYLWKWPVNSICKTADRLNPPQNRWMHGANPVQILRREMKKSRNLCGAEKFFPTTRGKHAVRWTDLKVLSLKEEKRQKIKQNMRDKPESVLPSSQSRFPIEKTRIACALPRSAQAQH